MKTLIHYLGSSSPWGATVAGIACGLFILAFILLVVPWLGLFFDWYYPFVRSFGA